MDIKELMKQAINEVLDERRLDLKPLPKRKIYIREMAEMASRSTDSIRKWCHSRDAPIRQERKGTAIYAYYDEWYKYCQSVSKKPTRLTS